MLARFTMEKILERHGERIPEHVRILDVGWDEKKRQSTITLECDYHGVDVVRPYYVNKTDYFCRHCGTSVRGYPMVMGAAIVTFALVRELWASSDLYGFVVPIALAVAPSMSPLIMIACRGLSISALVVGSFSKRAASRSGRS